VELIGTLLGIAFLLLLVGAIVCVLGYQRAINRAEDVQE